MTTRTVTPDREAIKRLRLANGWRIEDLAERAGCSVKTISNMEKGANAYIYTLNKVAKALGVEPAEIMAEAAPMTEIVEPKERAWTLTITLKTPYEDFDETRDLPLFLKAFSERLGLPPVEPVKIESGSTKITLHLTDEEAQVYDKNFHPHLFKDFPLETIEFVYAHGRDKSGAARDRLRKQEEERLKVLLARKAKEERERRGKQKKH